ncbi:MAG: hypothetical protein Kow0073_02610 [Immundisolibacter sp.]
MSSQVTSPDTNAPAPDPEVAAKAKRRRFSPQYKLRILREADALAETRGVSELVRRGERRSLLPRHQAENPERLTKFKRAVSHNR